MKRHKAVNAQQPFALITISLLLLLTIIPATYSSKAQTQVPQALQTIDLAGTQANITVLGANDDDHLGGNGTHSVFTQLPRAHALVSGDFNGDGIADLAIGAPEADFTPPGASPTPRPNAGAVYIVFGRQTFTSPTVIDANLTATTQPDIRIFGAANDDNVGFSLAVGDINGDGKTDLLIGAPGVDFGNPTVRTDTGAVYILLGSSTLTSRTIDLAQPNAINVAIYGEKAGDAFGSSIATGDVGGATLTTGEVGATTAIADLLIGAPGSKGPNGDRMNGGAAYFLFGGTGFTPNPATVTNVLDLANIAPNVRIFGVAGSSLGSSVAIGNVNTTGPGVLLAGAPHADRPASVNVIDTGAGFGIQGGSNLVPATGTTKNFDIAATDQSISIYGASAGDHAGASIAVGDVTGDGTDDVVLGAPDADGPGETRDGCGEAYVIAGGASLNPPQTGDLRINILPATVSLTIYGEAAGDHLGSFVTTGVLNTQGTQDNIAEAIVGSPGAASGKGTASVIFGGPSLTAINIRDLALSQDDLRVIGQTGGSELGWAIATGDLDNNRGGDLIMAAPFASNTNPARSANGKVYVLLAANETVPPVNQPPLVQVTAPNGGETLTALSNFNITWTASDPNGDNTIQSFEIRLSTDGGTTFNSIITTSLAGTARSFSWAVPSGVNTTQARIRVIATDNTNLMGQDDSNANFSITDTGVSVTLTAPNGGEQLIAGQNFTITWTVPPAIESQVAGFDLFLSTDGGATFSNNPIAANPLHPALGAGIRTFAWTVQNVCTSTARVLVVATSTTGARSSDSSDANFSISDRGPTIDINSMEIDPDAGRLILRTAQPAVGNEIPFAEGAVISISNDEAGTAFSAFNKFKSKKGGTKILTKGSINGQALGTFFPDNAVRILRLTNPPCGLTIIKVKRMGTQLVVFNPGVEQPE